LRLCPNPTRGAFSTPQTHSWFYGSERKRKGNSGGQGMKEKKGRGGTHQLWKEVDVYACFPWLDLTLISALKCLVGSACYDLLSGVCMR